MKFENATKYKVGQKYRLLEDRTLEKAGDVIAIKGIREDQVFYKNLRTKNKESFTLGSTYSCNLRPLTYQKSLHITTDGTTTFAVLKEGKKIIKRAEARCSLSDAFDFVIGAKIAFDRLLENNYAIIKQKEYNPGDKVKIVDRWSEDCHQKTGGEMDKWLGKIMTVYLKHYPNDYTMLEDSKFRWFPNAIEGKVFENVQSEEIKEEFKPFLLSAFTESHLGYIGDETIQTDEYGKKLKVGDVVALSSPIPLSNIFFDDHVVCKSENYPNGYIMGVANEIFENGRSGMRCIKKTKSHQEVEDGEIIQSIEYVKSEATANENH